ncbi:MAG: hypothetical protein WA419_21350 [Silvibacterium sp.]
MDAMVQRALSGGSPQDGAPDPAGAPELHCRVCELEVENTRLRLLVGELLVANQHLREGEPREMGERHRMSAG